MYNSNIFRIQTCKVISLQCPHRFSCNWKPAANKSAKDFSRISLPILHSSFNQPSTRISSIQNQSIRTHTPVPHHPPLSYSDYDNRLSIEFAPAFDFPLAIASLQKKREAHNVTAISPLLRDACAQRVLYSHGPAAAAVAALVACIFTAIHLRANSNGCNFSL